MLWRQHSSTVCNPNNYYEAKEQEGEDRSIFVSSGIQDGEEMAFSQKVKKAGLQWLEN